MDRGWYWKAGLIVAVTLLASDSPQRFARVGSRFLGEAFSAEQVELVDLAG